MTRAWGRARPSAGAGDLDAALAGRLADTMFALSTPSQVLILGCLLAGPQSVSDITQTLGMEQSAVSHRLRVLREHHLVRAERAGRMRLYALYGEHFSVLLEAGLRHIDPGRPRPAVGHLVLGEGAGGVSLRRPGPGLPQRPGGGHAGCVYRAGGPAVAAGPGSPRGYRGRAGPDTGPGDRPARLLRGHAAALLAVMGPGVVVLVADNDAGGIATYAQAGQDYGLRFVWLLLMLADRAPEVLAAAAARRTR